MNRPSHQLEDDAISTKSSELSQSVCELILGPGACKKKSEKLPPKSEKSIYFSFSNAAVEPPPPKQSSKLLPSKISDKSQEKVISAINYLKQSEIIADKKMSSKLSAKKASTSEAPPDNKQVALVETVPKFNSIETQTEAIETNTKTTNSESDCKCDVYEDRCQCPECNPPKCFYNAAQQPTRDYEENEDSSFPPTAPTSPRDEEGYCNCHSAPKQHRSCYCHYDDDMSEHSDDSYATDFLNLPYQNQDEYLDLLRELERKLIARNRERVRRTRQAFEKKSRQNKNLDEPVYDYGDEENASLFLKKIKPSKRGQRTTRGDQCNGGLAVPSCRKCHKRVNSDIMQNEKNWEQCNFIDSFTKHVAHERDNGAQIERSLNKAHWQLDPRTGEWMKVASFERTQVCNPMTSSARHHHHHHAKEGGDYRRKQCPCCHKKKLVYS